MGVCSSTKDKVEIEEIFDDNIDYERVREEYREKNNEDIFEIESKFYEYDVVSSRLIRKKLICKYLFFLPNGKFESVVHKNGINDVLIEGSINPKTKVLALKTKEQLLENNAYRIKNYIGKLVFKDDECIVKGKVTEDGQKGKSNLRNTSFEINFTTNYWNGSFSLGGNKDFHIHAFIKYHEFLFSGIGFDNKGVSIFKGSRENLDETKGGDKDKYQLKQVYIFSDEEKSENQYELKEKNTYLYNGKIQERGNTFECLVSNKDIGSDIKCIFKFSSL